MFINVIAASLEKVDQYNNDDSDGLSTIYSGQDSDSVFWSHPPPTCLLVQTSWIHIEVITIPPLFSSEKVEMN